jgi:hypothetical protein
MQTYQCDLMTTPNVQSQSSCPTRKPDCCNRYSASGSDLCTRFGTRTFAADFVTRRTACARRERARRHNDSCADGQHEQELPHFSSRTPTWGEERHPLYESPWELECFAAAARDLTLDQYLRVPDKMHVST